MKYIHHTLLLAVLLLSSCSLIEPGDTVSPNVTDDDFLNQPNAMQAWVNGVEKNFSLTMGYYAQLMEILSDNYYNNYTRSNRDFDEPNIKTNDEDVKQLQRYVATLRESVDYAFNTVAKHDSHITNDEKLTLYTAKTFSHILAGEFFTGLPDKDGGDVVDWKTHLNEAVTYADSAMLYANTDSAQAFIHTLKARVYYRLGEADKAVDEARRSLSLAPNYYKQVYFDGANNVNNVAQEAIWGTWFQPLPRLDFLDPKYVQLSSTYQSPVTIAKAEENYLIIAEALTCKGQTSAAKETLHNLLALVRKRPVLTNVDDHLEGRYNGGSKHYPDSSAYQVAAAPDEPFRSGLVLDRKVPNLISVPIISGTSVSDTMVDSCSTDDSLLKLVYLLRQEIFFGEGRRPADLGIRLPVCDVEAKHTTTAKGYDTAVVPPFIPNNGGMDDFTMDATTHKVVIAYDMNRIIVQNKHTDYVVPFVQ